jgi:hypothetical protein
MHGSHCPRVRKLCRVLSQLKHGKEEAMPCSIFSVTRQSISALAVLYFLEHGKGPFTEHGKGPFCVHGKDYAV